MAYRDILYETAGRVATITLNRPQRLNAISLGMPAELHDAVQRANGDDAVHVIVLTGAGRAFCSGYDLVDFAEKAGEQPGSQLGDDTGGPWDPMADYLGMKQNTEHFMSLWRSYKPTIARIHPWSRWRRTTRREDRVLDPHKWERPGVSGTCPGHPGMTPSGPALRCMLLDNGIHGDS